MSCAAQGSIALTSDVNGDHWVCVSLDSSDYALPDGAVMVRTRCVDVHEIAQTTDTSGLVAQRFTLKVTMGPSKQEYQDLAKKSHMDDLQLEIVQLRDRVSAIQRNQDYAKEKSLVLQSAIESSNRRSTWISVFQVRCCGLEGCC